MSIPPFLDILPYSKNVLEGLKVIRSLKCKLILNITSGVDVSVEVSHFGKEADVTFWELHVDHALDAFCGPEWLG